MQRNLKDYIVIGLKGMGMGAADVVPGVSGGTIAFISGIYQELIETIDNLGIGILKTWKQEGFKKMFEVYNLGFLISLFLGIFTSVISLAKVISFLLENHPILVWSFFFGLVLASILYVGKQIKKWNISIVLFMLIATALAYYVTIATPSIAPDELYYYLISGGIAIIAMILPGISGSFILVLLGSYGIVLSALTNFIEALLSGEWQQVKTNFIKVITFIIGCLVGLKLFSKVLKWMFTHKKDLTLAVLTGFMIGSLNKIWPWKKVISTRIDRHGEEVPLLEKSIAPLSFEGDAQLMFAILLAILGFGLILLMERIAIQKK
ncbi:DUF368 domain-containing protein [Polaribacter sp. WD7]|uniref:DUF368 domain-containing protein n=1 Tax=Polaribacter sp. WD7 TaxID=2269061 RepID=UPI000DF47C50|nr:DUF368 domain-containing protein [Polaribacter sp. WD7]RCS27454.1 DUF368 domain-containing protein [Polaribacter sp. WD7]